MTNPNDMIRRGDALAELDSNAKGTIRLGGQNFRTIQLEEAAAAIAALPAVNTDPIGYISAVTDPQIATLQAERVVQPKMSESDFDCLILDAMAEAMKAMRKFPQPNYVISKFAEEAGEVVKAAIHCAEGRETAENVRGEMKQTIAMLYRLWIEGDQVHGLKPISALLAELETKA